MVIEIDKNDQDDDSQDDKLAEHVADQDQDNGYSN
jgi:hypothetical protein